MADIKLVTIANIAQFELQPDGNYVLFKPIGYNGRAILWGRSDSRIFTRHEVDFVATEMWKFGADVRLDGRSYPLLLCNLKEETRH